MLDNVSAEYDSLYNFTIKLNRRIKEQEEQNKKLKAEIQQWLNAVNHK